MKKISFITTLFSLFLLSSCTKTDPGPVNDDTTPAYLKGKGVFILNEGNFRTGNGSLSFYSYDSARLYNNVFFNINNRPLGDIPNSMVIRENKAYIVVNNSGKIEVVDKNSLLSLETITGLVSPRNILVVSNNKAYVSSLYSDSLTILNISNYSISGFINIRRTSEAMILYGGKAYVSNWLSGKEIMVINTQTDKVIDSIEVAIEPESMVLDKNNKLWVLCNGGYLMQNFAELIAINTITDEIDKRFLFSSKVSSPTSLQINNGRDTLLYLANNGRDTLFYMDKDVWRMEIIASSLPIQPFILASGRIFNKLGVNPENNEIFLTDAIDYQQKGFVYRFKPGGELTASCRAEIIPGSFCFKK
jgi:YVTN family beta-propeller protein